MRAYVTYTFGVNFHPVDTFEPALKTARVGTNNYTPLVEGTAKAGDGSTYQVSFPVLSLELQGEDALNAFHTALSERIAKMLSDFKTKWNDINAVPAPVKEEKPSPVKVVKKPAKKAKK